MDKYYCWVCDFSKISGEGNLANLFINKNFYNDYLIYTPFSLITNKKFKNIINYKYISPFIGIIFCWYLFIKKKKVAYINYLPLWNFFIFALLPPKTLFGPITGGANFKKKNNIIRRLLFPIFYKLSEFFLIIRNEKVNFSTDLLKKYLSTYSITRSKFNSGFNYLFKNFPFYWLDVGSVCDLRVCHNGCGIGIYQDYDVALFPKRLTCLSPAVIKLTSLTNDNRA